MKPVVCLRSCSCSGPADRSRRGFSLPEALMVMALLSILLGGAVASHIFGLRLMEIIDAKGSASSEARRNTLALMQEICSARMVAVGDGTLNSFSEAGMDVPQRGSALQLYPSTDTNVFVRYFLDLVDRKLKRMTNGATIAVVVASGITNTEVFTAEDRAGNTLSNKQGNCAIGLTLHFCQMPRANVPVGPSQFFTSYQLRTKIAQRAL